MVEDFRSRKDSRTSHYRATSVTIKSSLSTSHTGTGLQPAEALLDFASVDDLEAWLNMQNKKDS